LASASGKLACPVPLSARLPSVTGVVVAVSLRVTVPAGMPWELVTLTETAVSEQVPAGLVCALDGPFCTAIAVEVVTPCALAAAVNRGNANAIASPATNLSRRLRRFMPLTCTCSKSG